MRALPENPFADDDGAAHPALQQALARYQSAHHSATQHPSGQPNRDCAAVVAAMRDARLLIAVGPVDSGARAPAGSAAAGTDMALAILSAPDGRATLPVFSCTEELARWNPASRPVPVAARRAFLAAVSESCELVVVDPAGAAVAVPRPAVWALAQDVPWQPSYESEAVCEAVAAAARAVPGVLGARCSAGERAELAVHLDLPPGLGATQLDRLTAVVSQRLSCLDIVAAKVDSLELKPRPVRTPERQPSPARRRRDERPDPD